MLPIRVIYSEQCRYRNRGQWPRKRCRNLTDYQEVFGAECLLTCHVFMGYRKLQASASGTFLILHMPWTWKDACSLLTTAWYYKLYLLLLWICQPLCHVSWLCASAWELSHIWTDVTPLEVKNRSWNVEIRLAGNMILGFCSQLWTTDHWYRRKWRKN